LLDLQNNYSDYLKAIPEEIGRLRLELKAETVAAQFQQMIDMPVTESTGEYYDHCFCFPRVSADELDSACQQLNRLKGKIMILAPSLPNDHQQFTNLEFRTAETARQILQILSAKLLIGHTHYLPVGMRVRLDYFEELRQSREMAVNFNLLKVEFDGGRFFPTNRNTTEDLLSEQNPVSFSLSHYIHIYLLARVNFWLTRELMTQLILAGLPTLITQTTVLSR
jgi:hypothetical protein